MKKCLQSLSQSMFSELETTLVPHILFSNEQSRLSQYVSSTLVRQRTLHGSENVRD